MLQKNIFVSLLLSFILLCSAAVFPGVKTAAAQEETALTETGLEGQLTLEALQALNNDQARRLLKPPLVEPAHAPKNRCRAWKTRKRSSIP